MNKQREETTLKDLADIFIPKVWFIVLVAVIFAGAFGGYSMFFKQNTYTSTAIYMIGKIPYSRLNALSYKFYNFKPLHHIGLR